MLRVGLPISAGIASPTASFFVSVHFLPGAMDKKIVEIKRRKYRISWQQYVSNKKQLNFPSGSATAYENINDSKKYYII